MLTIETIACDLNLLSVSRCIGPEKNSMTCPNRSANERHSKRCAACEDALARVLWFVTERVSMILRRWRVAGAEDIAADIVLEYQHRLEHGGLGCIWRPGMPAWKFASKRFLKMRIATAVERQRKLTEEESPVTNLSVRLESLREARTSARSTPAIDPSDPLPPLAEMLGVANWTGTASEIVAAVQLLPLLGEVIVANKPLMASLAQALGPVSLARLDAYHAEKALKVEKKIDRLAHSVHVSRKATKVAEYRRQIAHLREEKFLVPLSAKDLMVLLPLEKEAAYMRMRRYRQFLAEHLGPFLPPESALCRSIRAGPRAATIVTHAEDWRGGTSWGIHDVNSGTRSSVMRFHSRVFWSVPEQRNSEICVAVTGKAPGSSETLTCRLIIGSAGLFLQCGSALHRSLRGVRMGSYPAFKSTQRKRSWRFVQPLSKSAALTFAYSDLVLTLRNGRRLRLAMPLLQPSKSAVTTSRRADNGRNFT